MINIINKENCCGCEACFNACPQKCISMISDEEGFLYPHVENDSCIDCGICETVCPINDFAPKEIEKDQKAYLLQHKDEKICRESTSGGAFTGIASYVLEKGGVVFGVEMAKNFLVKHTAIYNIDDLAKLRNSKYVQSRINDIYQKVQTELNKGVLTCFSGTPCQIEGLRHFLGKEYDNLILVDVVCRAVPSPGVWEKYINYETEKKGGINSVRFRDKKYGYQYSTMEIVSNDGKIYRGGIEDQPWLRMFFSGMIIRPSCVNCKFRSRNRNSDLTIWDCFPSYKFDKKFNEKKGTTRVLVHSLKGQEIINSIKDNYQFSEVNADVAVSGVNEMVMQPQINDKRDEFFNSLQEKPFGTVLEEFFPLSIKVKIKRIARRILNGCGLDTYIKRILRRG